MSKITTISQLKTSLQSAKNYIDAQDAALSGRIDAVVANVEELIEKNGETNVLEGVKVNGQALAITDKMVDIIIESGKENGTIDVNGAAVAVKGLTSIAFKNKISADDFDEALKASIASHATNADLEALTVRVTNAEGEITEIKGDIEALENAGYQNAEQVQSAIQAAIAASGHAHFEKVDAVPTAETAKENVMYLVMNAETGHYDIYALVGETVELLDDTTVDMSNYSTTEQMNTAISAAVVEALNNGDYAKAADLLAAIDRIAAVEAKFANYYTSEQVDAKLAEKMNVADMGAYATDEEAAAEATAKANAALESAKSYTDEEATAKANAALETAKSYTDEQLTNATATDEEVSDMLDEVFGE